jgi:hypothetical protein
MANNNNDTQSKTYKQQAGEYYNRQYDSWMPWIEDKYLAWFTKDNKASYATKRMSLLSLFSVLPTPQPTTYSPTRQKTSTRPKSPATSKSTQPKTASTAS